MLEQLLMGGAAALVAAHCAFGDIILDQPHDFVDRSPAERGTAVPFARTADDFVIPNRGKSFLWSVTVEMIVSFPNSPEDFVLEVHFGDLPSGPTFVFPTVDEVVDHGAWNGDPNLHLLSVKFDTKGQMVSPGRHWVVPYAIGNGSRTDRAFWGTAGNGQVNGSEAYFRSDHFGVPEWTPISDSGILDFPTDFAMTIEATIPAPGALALLGFAVVLPRRALARRLNR